MKYQKLTLNKKNIKDFATERNILQSKSKSKWIFFVDSDETAPPALQDEINNLQFTIYNSYYVNRKNYFLGQYVGTDKIIRLVRKGSGKWTRAVHEIWKPHDKVHLGGVLKNYLKHDTTKNLKSYIDKIDNYSSLHGLANKKEGKRSNLFKIIFFPVFKFFQTFLKSRHVVFSIMQSFHSFLSWSKLYFLQH